VVQGNGYPLRDHPEYKMEGADGKPIDRICLNSPYIKHAKQVVEEMLGYDIDGFHIDMLDQGFGPPYGCWCPNCRARFEAEYGIDMPNGVTWDEAWDKMMAFRFNTSVRFEKELLNHIRSINPRVSVDFNYHGSPPFSWEVGQLPVQHSHIGDFVTGESGVWAFGALHSSLNAMFLAATDPAGITQVVMQRGVRVYHDQTTRPLNDMRWEMMTMLMHGVSVTIVDKTPFDGSLDRVAYERYGQVFEEAQAKRVHLGRGHRPVREVGVYYSSRSRDWYGRETPAKYQQPFVGAHKAMTYEHIPMGVVLDENISAELLAQYPIVYLPNAAIVSEKEGILLREYVERGGNLILTGFTGLFGKMGEPLGQHALADLIGAEYVEKLKTIDNHVAFANVPDEFAALAKDIPADWPFLVRGNAVVYKPTSAAAIGELYKPVRTVLQQQGKEGTEMPGSPDAVVGPAILVNKFGKGKVVCFACAPDEAIAGEYRMTEDRLLLRNAVRYLNPNPPVTIHAPLNVEAVVTEGPEANTARVHFAAYLSPPGCTPVNRPYIMPSLIEDLPLFRAQVRFAKPVKVAKPFGKTTEIKADENGFDATINDIHEVIVVEF
jgi:hypothetical protein